MGKKNTLLAYYIRVTKWLVICLQSNPIGTNFAGYMFTKQFYWYKRRGLLFKLRRPRAFQLSRGLSLGAYWLAGSRSPDGGGESHHFTGNRNPSPGRLPAPAPAAPHHGPALGGKSKRRPGYRILIPAVGPWQRQTSGPGPAFRSHPSCPCVCSLQWMEADCWLPPLTGTDFSLPWNSLIKRAYERRNWRWGRTWTTYWIHEFRF